MSFKAQEEKIESWEQQIFSHFGILILLFGSVAGTVPWLATEFKWSGKESFMEHRKIAE